jgi:hypothetical protein
MIDHATFSALRLSRVFPAEHLESYRFYIEVDPEGDFDLEYMGGQWHEELIDGVQFFFPKRDGKTLGAAELWGSGCVIAAAVRDRPEAHSASLIPSWTANANRVLEALEVPIRMGSDEAAVRALAAGKVLDTGFPDEWYSRCPDVAKGTLRSLLFACRAPGIYHVKAVVHSTEGLLSLAVHRPDLVRSNDHDGAYDACFAGLYDEGPG